MHFDILIHPGTLLLVILVSAKQVVRPFITQNFLRFKNGPFLPILFVTSFLNFLVRV